MTIAELKKVLDLASGCLHDGENAEVFLEDEDGVPYTITECRLHTRDGYGLTPGRLVLL